MNRIVNESTSVIQIDTSGLQSGQVSLVYISSTSIPGQLVTITDARGFISSPQAILLSTTGGTLFSDGTYSTTIQQRFGYYTIASQLNGRWAPVNVFPFSQTNSVNYKGVDSWIISTNTLRASGVVSTITTTTVGINATAAAEIGGVLYTSTLNVNSAPTSTPLTVSGDSLIYGSTLTTGAGSFSGSISTLGNLFSLGNISSKSGTMYIEGDVSILGSVRGQRGQQITAAAANIKNSATFATFLTLYSTFTVGSNCTAYSITSDTMSGQTLNAISSIQFNQGVGIFNTSNALAFLSTYITVPSTISSLSVRAGTDITTSNLSLTNFTGMSTLAYLTLSSAQISNRDGSLIVSSLEGVSFASRTLMSKSLENATTFATNTIAMNDQGISTPLNILYNGATISTNVYWTISSVSTNGSFTAPYSYLSANICIANNTVADRLNTALDTFVNVFTSTMDISGTVDMSGARCSVKNTLINNRGGSIIGGRADIIQDIHCSSIQTDALTSLSSILFNGATQFILPNTFISTIGLNTARTSSLAVSQIITGSSAGYSTISPSSAWLLPSTFNMGTPFTTTTGLGSYVDQVNFVATSNQTAYYSLIDPSALAKQYLSTPYVNTAGANIGLTIGQAASGTDHSLYFGATDASGWKLKKITPQGTLLTLAGQPRYFYGDGGFPINAAFGPQLAVSLFSPGQILITDISNVRLRLVNSDPIVKTIAGTGQLGYTGNNGNPLLATFSTPLGTLSVSNGSTIYVADRDNQVIRILSGSTISTFAGTGVAGSTGDGGPASAAKLSRPYAITRDSAQNILFTDLSNCAVRKIATDGTISLVAGTYTKGYGGDGGPATAATFSYPTGITVDSSNAIYVCDTGNARVRRIDPITQIITTVAGNGTAAYGGDGGLAVSANLSSPTGVTTDAAGNLYIADRDNQCIRFVTRTTGNIATVAGRPGRAGYSGDYSFATFATLNTPTGVVFDSSSSNYYIADEGNNVVRYVDSRRLIINTAAGNGSPISAGDGGPAAAAVFGNITSVSTDSRNNIYVTDGLANRIRQIHATDSTIRTVVGTGVGGFSGDGGQAVAANISTPGTALFDRSNNLYFTDTYNQRVRRVDAATSTIQTIAGTGLAEYNGDSISSLSASLNFPGPLTLSTDDTLYVGDTLNYRIRSLGNDGITRTFAGFGANGILQAGQTLASTSFGILGGLASVSSIVYATDATTSAIWAFNSATNMVEGISAYSTPAYLGDAAPLSNALFNQPTGIIADSSGNLVICDSRNYRVRRSYTFGRPQNPLYLTMNMAYTNYFTTSGYAQIKLNGNTLATFDAALESNLTYQVAHLPVFNYPLQSSNPVYGDQTPFLEITQQGSTGYVKLAGNFYVAQEANGSLLHNLVNSDSGIQMNLGTLIFPNPVNAITIDNKLNDASMRTVNYTGSLISASDPALKEQIEGADLGRCYSTLNDLPLRTYSYIEAYVSTFHLEGGQRFGFLTSEVKPFFPNSVTRTPFETGWASSIDTLDLTQIKCAHLGVTKMLLTTIEGLEGEVSTLRSLVAQRKSIS